MKDTSAVNTVLLTGILIGVFAKDRLISMLSKNGKNNKNNHGLCLTREEHRELCELKTDPIIKGVEEIRKDVGFIREHIITHTTGGK
jgi:hypothetical protein